MQLSRRTIDILTAIAGGLTVLAMVPYEKDLLGLFPPTWTPYLLVIGAVATVALRILKAFLPPPVPPASVSVDPSSSTTSNLP